MTGILIKNSRKTEEKGDRKRETEIRVMRSQGKGCLESPGADSDSKGSPIVPEKVVQYTEKPELLVLG